MNKRLAIIIGAIVLAVVLVIAAVLIINTVTTAQNSYDRSFCEAAGGDDC